MSKNTYVLLTAFEKIGAPLVTSIGEVQSWWAGEQEIDATEEAQALSALIAQTVSISKDVAKHIGADAGLAVASVVSPLVATHYKATGKVPGKKEAARIIAAVDALMALGEDYAKEAGAPEASSYHASVLRAMLPVINATARFSFGQAENILLRDVSKTLRDRAEKLREEFEGDEVFEIGALNVLAKIYADCHAAETEKMLSDESGARGQGSLDDVWKCFDMRVGMLISLSQHLKSEAA